MIEQSIQNSLNSYLMDTENPELNYSLARLYYGANQTAAALSFFLRAAERTSDKNLAYECLLMIGHCFEKPKNRTNSVRGAFYQAMMLLPNRPEAYFLLARTHEKSQSYVSGYTTAEVGLQFADFTLPPLRGDVEYVGKYGLIFEKAVCAWWWGKSAESRKLFHTLADDYVDQLDESHYKALQINLTNLGSGPESQAFRYYDQAKHDQLRYKFEGSDKIKRSYSQVFQDIFVLSMTKGKRNGTYLEIGSASPYFGNNTALLETEYGWTGLGIEYKQELVDEYKKHRKNPVLMSDATQVNYVKLLKDLSSNGVVDYLQLDCEPSKVTFEILLKIPFDQFKFGVITYEHDYYVDITRSYREKSRKYLRAMGYELVVSDVSPDGISTFEDWWVHPDLIDKDVIEKMKDLNGIKQIEKYFYIK